MMASPVVKLISEAFLNADHKCFQLSIRHSSVIKKPKQRKETIKHRNLIESTCTSLASRGFLRSYKPYKPTENVKSVILGFCNNILGANFDQDLDLSKEKKFLLLSTCFEKLNHSVPNSLLHKINNVKDIIEFYETQVSTTVPYDELKNQDLPPNLHIQNDYIRFNAENSSIFDNITAFPKSSTIVTGIKYKEKYKGYMTDSPYLETEALIKKISIF